MSPRRKDILLLGVVLSWGGLLLIMKYSLLSPESRADSLKGGALLVHRRLTQATNLQVIGGEVYATEGTTEVGPVTAVVPRVWERYPGHTWRGLQLPILTAQPMGRLGNVMGEYASLYALGRAYNTTVLLSPSMKQYMRKIFPYLSMPVIPGKFEQREWTRLKGLSVTNYVRNEMAAAGLLGPGLFLLTDWPFETQLFDSYREEVVKELTFTPRVIQQAESFLGSVVRKSQAKQATPPVLVGIHVRRTDYVDFIKKYEGHVPGQEYFQQAMQYYRGKFPHVIFIVASDNPQFVAQQFANYSDVVFVPGGTREEDLATLASCNHSIISVGSYSFWSGYLTGGEVLYPNITFKKTYTFSGYWYTMSRLKNFTPIPVD